MPTARELWDRMTPEMRHAHRQGKHISWTGRIMDPFPFLIPELPPIMMSKPKVGKTTCWICEAIKNGEKRWTTRTLSNDSSTSNVENADSGGASETHHSKNEKNGSVLGVAQRGALRKKPQNSKKGKMKHDPTSKKISHVFTGRQRRTLRGRKNR